MSRCRAKHQTAVVRRVGWLDGSDSSTGAAYIITIACRFGHRRDVEFLTMGRP